MLTVKYSTIKNKLNDYFNKVSNLDEVVIVKRRNGKDVVFISTDKYDRLEKAAKNNDYLIMIDRSIAQLEAGHGQEHELIDVD